MRGRSVLLERVSEMEIWLYTLAAWAVTREEWRQAAQDFLDLAYLLGDLREVLSGT